MTTLGGLRLQTNGSPSTTTWDTQTDFTTLGPVGFRTLDATAGDTLELPASPLAFRNSTATSLRPTRPRRLTTTPSTTRRSSKAGSTSRRTAKLTRKSAYRFVKMLKKGTHKLRVDMASDRCHFAGKSSLKTAKLR